jgi:hypothetical protein
MHKTSLWLALVLALAPRVDGQKLVDNGIDDRIEALNAVFAFRSDLRRDSTVIARCRIPTANLDSGDIRGLEARFQSLLVGPDTVQRGSMKGCPVHGFADRKLRVLWLEDMIEIKKTASVGILPESRRTQFEITFQLLAGPSYREFHRYIVEPSGVTQASSRGEMTIAGWRVTEYKLLGWDFHWGDNLGHGSGVRLP